VEVLQNEQPIIKAKKNMEIKPSKGKMRYCLHLFNTSNILPYL